jgi:hypothetical protein
MKRRWIAARWAALLVGGGCAAIALPKAPTARYRATPRDPACLARFDGKRPLALGDGWRQRFCNDLRVVETEGKPFDGEELVAFQKRHGRGWFLPGVETHGLGGCCPAPGEGRQNVLCVHVYMNGCMSPAEDVARRIQADARADGLGDRQVTIGFMLGAPRAPRCQPRDRGCGPEPYSGGRPSHGRPRVAVHLSERYFGELSGGSCAHDGECTRAGCGNHCVPWTEPSFGATCEAYDALEGAFCGCLEGQCTWFRQ